MTDTKSLRFSDLKLIPALLDALHTEGYEEPTPIQAQAIPTILEGRDLLGCAQTGTGKTAAFALPILQLLAERPVPAGSRAVRALILTPTRELAAQIGESFTRYGSKLNLKNVVIFGGVGQGPQVGALRRGVEILVATPGRLLDLKEQRLLDLSHIEIFVLDEADRMLDMGFIHDVKRIIKLLPKKRHTLFFSATMPQDIQRLAHDILTDPVKVEVTPIATTAEKIEQSVLFVEKSDKRRLLESLMLDPKIERALVFSRTKHGADRIAKFLNEARVPAEAIHGNKSQNNRVRALNNFKEGNVRVLVATDIAARGIDIDGVSHVINYELPNIPESYVHRIGRTARAGAEGVAISFCDREERAYLKDIERLTRQSIRVATHALSASVPSRPVEADRPPTHRPSSGGQRNRHPSRGRPSSPDRRPSSGDRSPRQGAPSSSRRGPGQRPNRAGGSASSAPRGGQRSRSSGSPEVRREASSRPAASAKKPWWKKLLPGTD